MISIEAARLAISSVTEDGDENLKEIPVFSRRRSRACTGEQVHATPGEEMLRIDVLANATSIPVRCVKESMTSPRGPAGMLMELRAELTAWV